LISLIRKKEVLKNLIEFYLSELREKVVKIESSKWKPLLHDEEETINKIIGKLS
jgi:hypothetical protein